MASRLPYLELQRFEEYYLSSGDIYFVVENNLFKVHRYFFERESAFFKKLLATATSPGAPPIGTTESNAIFLDDVRCAEFAKLLWVFYNPKYSHDDTPIETWTTILDLSHYWGFADVKAFVVRELEKLEIPDIERIVLYRRFDVAESYLIPYYVALCERPEPLTFEEGHILGVDTIVSLSHARESLRSPVSSSHVTSPIDIVKDHFHLQRTGGSGQPISSLKGNLSPPMTPQSPCQGTFYPPSMCSGQHVLGPNDGGSADFSSLPRLNTTAIGSSLRPTSKIVLKRADGTPVKLENLKQQSQSPGHSNRKPVQIRIESEEARKKRIAAQQTKGKEDHGPLDVSSTQQPRVPATLPSALATARIIDDLSQVTYPENIQRPRSELNINAQGSKFRYDRDFLLQFMPICKEKPDNLPPLDAMSIGLVDRNAAPASSRRDTHGPKKPLSSSAFRGNNTASSPRLGAKTAYAFDQSRLGINELTSQEHYELTIGARAARSAVVSSLDSNPQATQSTSFGGDVFADQVLEIPRPSPNRWNRRALDQIDSNSAEMVDRKVKSLLNKLSMENFDSISDQITEWANKSEKEKDGRTLIQVIRLVFERATVEEMWSEMYARLCRKMMEQISPQVQDDGIKNADGKPIAGGQLFRKYLLTRCQEGFERGWITKEATESALTKAMDVQAARVAKEKESISAETNEDPSPYFHKYYAARKAQRRSVTLIKFIGELFKLQMLTERIMHECVKKLLGNVENPEEEEIESLCKLMLTVGSLLDTAKTRAHMDVYFSRMKELCKSNNVGSRVQFMLQDVIELRERRWVPRTQVAPPSKIAAVHEAAAKDAKVEKEYQRTISMLHGGSGRGTDRGGLQGPDGWTNFASNSAPRPPPKAGDLSNLGKIGGKGLPMTFGPSSLFAGKDSKRESLTRTSSSSNMFSMLRIADASNDSKPAAAELSAPSRRPMLTAEERRELAGPVSYEAAPEITAEAADKKIGEHLKEFFAVRNLDEAEFYFTTLPPIHHHRLVEKLVGAAVEAKEANVQLVADLFERVVSRELCSFKAFEEGFSRLIEILGDITIDAPKAPNSMALMMEAVWGERSEDIAAKMLGALCRE